MFHPAPIADDVSPIEANIDRMYWSSLLNGHMMPGLGLAASRLRGPKERTIRIPEGLSQTAQLRLRATAETDRR